MKKLYNSIDQIIGRTPAMKLERTKKRLGLKADIVVKLEYLNPAGSVKDRVAISLISSAEKEGSLQPGGTIIEPTSGNTTPE